MTTIEECTKSEMPIKTWCNRNNISEQSYYYRLKKIRTQEVQEISKNDINYIHICCTGVSVFDSFSYIFKICVNIQVVIFFIFNRTAPAYSNIERVKANGLDSYLYLSTIFKYLRSQNSIEEPELIDKLLLWSDLIQESCKN